MIEPSNSEKYGCCSSGVFCWQITRLDM